MTQPQLVEPGGRQGPGQMPQGLVEALDLVVARRVGGVMPGDRLGSGVGSGTEIAQLRPYEVGDDVRQIDAAATARTGEPHVRVHVPERTLTTWIVVDVSPSMAFGTAERLKSDVAEGVAQVIGRLAVRRAGRVALMTCGAARPRLMPPRAARPGLVALGRALAEGVVPDGAADPAALSTALVRLAKVAKQAGLVVIVSDFRDQNDWTRALGALSARHSVLAVEVRDPRESELPNAGQLALVDPESGELIQVDTSRRRVRERFAELEAADRARVARELRRLRVEHVVVTTEGDWLRQLGRKLK
ncbi:MAG TPA: DUF58 domain-containing protein [Thermoleophilaceae bacterium]